MTFRVREASELSASESASLRRLDAEAFVSEDEIDLLGRKMEWAPPRWHLACWNNDEAICHVGIILRTGTLNGVEVAIGGVGGVATSPASQGKGLSSEGLEGTRLLERTLRRFRLADLPRRTYSVLSQKGLELVHRSCRNNSKRKEAILLPEQCNGLSHWYRLEN